MIYPPFVEGPVWADIDSLFRWRCLCKSITNVCAIDDKVLCRGDGIE